MAHSPSGGWEVPSAALVGFSVSRLAATAPHRAARTLGRAVEVLAEGQPDMAVTEVGSVHAVGAVYDLLAEGRATARYVAVVA